MKQIVKEIIVLIIVVLITIALLSLFALLIQWLWNHVLVLVTYASAITFWQSWGVMLLGYLVAGDKGWLVSLLWSRR